MTRGACASGDLHSARAGADVLAAGGNAVDAAVAAGLMACVTLPTMTSLGGGGVLTLAVDGRVEVCDCFAALPGLGLDRRGARELDVVSVSFEGIPVDFRVRAPSIAVPGTVAGLWEVHRRHGGMPLHEVAAPAVTAAREGYEVTPSQTRAFELLDEIFRLTPETWALVSNGDAVAGPGEVLRNEPLAASLELLVAEGPQAFYAGDLARGIVEAAEGWLTLRDLAAYRAVFRTPLEGGYRGWRLHLPAMPSVTSGMLLAALQALEAGGPLPRPLDVVGWGRVADAMRRGAAVRTPEYEQRLFEEGWLQARFAANPGGNTMHVATADEAGNLVAYTTTVGESAGLTAPGSGIVLNNFLGEEDIHPAGRTVEAGRRMMTSMCPLLLDDGHGRRVALGSAGSARIKSALLQVLVNLVDQGLAPREAVRAPRIHVEGETLYIEGHGRTREQVDALRPLAEDVRVTWDCGFFFGGAQAVEFAPNGLRAAADEERRGCAACVLPS
jgi:gamma-glutamyltranspeptidase/glutathione hydrolase